MRVRRARACVHVVRACVRALRAVGPTIENLNTFADKTSARAEAIKAGVPVVPGTDGPVTSAESVRCHVTAT